ncbi:MAG: glycosyltransferase family 2 protein [Acidobacteria bacterium]|nr:glycosyltransferase family 2 protein [Acidobacteriota bacterium]
MLVSPRVFVVIVNYSGARWLRPCLDTLLKTSYVNFSVIVVDNASTDNSREIITEHYSQITLLAEKQNLGFSAGNNIGIRYALACQADYVVLLNPDTKVKPNWLTALIDVAEKEPDVGILGGVQLRYDDDEWNSWTSAVLSSRQKDLLTDSARCPAWLEMEWVEGACFAIKRTVLEKVGLFDAIYFSFYEELDYCRRARYHGFRTALVTGCRLHHFRGGVWQADEQRRRMRDYQCDKSQFIYSLTAPDKSLLGNLRNYFVTLAVKAKEALLALRCRHFFALALMQFSVWRNGAALWRKWRADRLRLSGYGLS